MNLCSDGHIEVCYDSRKCPMCELIAGKEDLEDDLKVLKAELDRLKAELSAFWS